MTSPSDIAGLSERLRDAAHDPTMGIAGYCLLVDEAATALDSLTARVKELEDHNRRLGQGGAERYWEDRYRDEAAALARAEQQRDEAYERLKVLVEAKALAGVRKLVAGWNGEDRPEGPFSERHPDKLGATLPKTNCGAVYQLDDAMVAARDLIRRLASGQEGGAKP